MQWCRSLRAIAAAEKAAAPMAALASWQRREILEHCVTQFKARGTQPVAPMT